MPYVIMTTYKNGDDAEVDNYWHKKKAIEAAEAYRLTRGRGRPVYVVHRNARGEEIVEEFDPVEGPILNVGPLRDRTIVRREKYGKDATAEALRTMTMDQIVEWAENLGIATEKYTHLSNGLARMNLGNMIRRMVGG